MRSLHLGDGAYASLNDWGQLIITANHHDPDEIRDRVYLEPYAVKRLLQFIDNPNLGDEV